MILVCNFVSDMTLIPNVPLKIKSKGKEMNEFIKKIGGVGVEIKGGGSQEIEVSPPETLKFNYFPWDSQEEIANSISPCQERLIKKIKSPSSFPIPTKLFPKKHCFN